MDAPINPNQGQKIELSDADVFGTSSVAPKQELSDADVFGSAPAGVASAFNQPSPKAEPKQESAWKIPAAGMVQPIADRQKVLISRDGTTHEPAVWHAPSQTFRQEVLPATDEHPAVYNSFTPGEVKQYAPLGSWDEAFGTAAKRSIIPTAAGVAAGKLATTALSRVPGIVGELMTRESLPGMLAQAGAFTVGSLGGSAAVEPLNEKLWGKLTPEQQLNAQEHPFANWAGGMAPSVIAFHPNLDTTIGQRLMNAGMMTGIGVGTDLATGNKITPWSVLGHAAGGAFLGRPNRIGRFIEAPGAAIGNIGRTPTVINSGFEPTGNLIPVSDTNPSTSGEQVVPLGEATQPVSVKQPATVATPIPEPTVAPVAVQPEAIPAPQVKPTLEARPAPVAEQPIAEATPEPTPVSQEVPAPAEQPATQELPKSIQMLDAEAAASAKPRVVVPALPRAKEAVQPVVEPTPALTPTAEAKPATAEAKPATPDVDPVTGKKLPQGVIEARKTADALIAAGLGDTAAAKNAVAQVNRWEDQNGRPKSYQTQQGELGQQPVVQPTERPTLAAEPIKRSKAIQDAIDQADKLEKSLAGATEKDRPRIERQLKLRRDQINADDVRNGRNPTYGEAEQPALPVQAEAKPVASTSAQTSGDKPLTPFENGKFVVNKGHTNEQRLTLDEFLKYAEQQASRPHAGPGEAEAWRKEAALAKGMTPPPTPAAKPAKPVVKPAAQTEIPGTADAFNLAGEKVNAPEETPANRPDNLTGELPGATTEAKPSSEATTTPEANGTTWNGQNVQFTGNTKKQKGGTFYEFQFKDGEKKGQMGYTNSDEFKAAHEDAVKNPPPPIEVGAEVKPKEKKVLSKGNPDEPASVQQARRVINGETERSGGKRFDKALDLVEQYEADQKLSKYEMPENLDKASDQGIEDFLKKHEERVAYEKGEGIEGNKAENDFAEKVREYFDNRMNASTMMGDVIKDLRSLGIKLPTIPTWFPDKHGQAYADVIKGIAPDLFAPPPMLRRMVSAETLKDPHWRAKATAQVEGMIEWAHTLLSEMGWTQLDPSLHSGYDPLLDLLTKHANGEATYPAGGVGGADRTNPRKYTPVEKKISFLDSAEAWADAKLKEGLGRTNTGVDPEMAVALAIKGVAHAGRAAGDFAVWSKAMISEFGNAVKPHLEAAWEKLKDLPALQSEAYAHQLARDEAGRPPLDLHAAIAEEALKQDAAKEVIAAAASDKTPTVSTFQKAINAGPVAFFRAVGSRMRSLAEINPQSPAMKEAVEAFIGTPGKTTQRDFLTAHSNQVKAFANRIETAMQPIAKLIKGMSPEAQRNLQVQMIKAIESNADVGGHIGSAIKEIKSVLADMHTYANESGLKVGEVKDYFPRKVEANLVIKDPAGFVAAAEKAYEAKWRREAQAEASKEGLSAPEPTSKDKLDFRNQAIAWKDAIVLNKEGWNFEKGIFENTKPSKEENFQKEREFTKEEAKHFEDYRNTNIWKILASHINTTVKQSELARRLGADGEKYLDLKQRMKQEGVPPEHVNSYEEYVKNMIGYTPPKDIGINPEVAQTVMNTSNLLTTLKYLAKTPLLVAAEPAGIAHHTGETFSGPLIVGRNLIRLANIMRRASPKAISDANAMVEQQYGKGHDLASALALELGITSAHGPFMEGASGYMPDEFHENTGKMRELMNKVHAGMFLDAAETAKRETGVNESMRYLQRLVDHATGQNTLSQIFEKAGISTEKGMFDTSKYGTEKLKGLGIPEAEHADFADFVNGLKKMKPTDRFNAIADKENPMAGRYRNAVELFTKAAVVQTTTGSRAAAANASHIGRALFMLNTYSNEYALQHREALYNEALKLTNKDGGNTSAGERLMAFKHLAALPMTMAMMYGVGQIYKAMNGQLDDKGKKAMFGLPHLPVDIVSSGFRTGISGSGLDMVWKAMEREQLPLPVVLGPLADVSKGVFEQAKNPGSNAANKAIIKTGFSTAVAPAVNLGLTQATAAAPGILKAIPFAAQQVMANPKTAEAVSNAAGGSSQPQSAQTSKGHPKKK